MQRLVTELLNKVGGAFVQDLQQQRGRRLRANVDYGTGEVWSGMEAKALGLVDEIGAMETVIADEAKLKIFNFGPRDEGFASFSGRFMGSVLDALGEFNLRSAIQIRQF